MKWRDTQYEDLHRIVLKDDPSDADMRSVLSDTVETRNLLLENARTWEEGETIFAVVGVGPMWKGVGVVWTLLSEDIRPRGPMLTRGVLRFIEMLHVERGYWRLQATVETADAAARWWILKLGFAFEGTMVGYGPDGRDHDLYARVRL